MTREFYIYFHINISNDEIFYIGKGCGNRCNHKNRSDWWKKYTKKYEYDILLIEENLTEEESFELEKYYINKIGRRDLGLGTLLNMTDGGDGISGFKMTEESKEKMRVKKINSIPWNKGKKGFTAWNKGKKTGKMTEESKEKMSEAKKGRIPSNHKEMVQLNCKEINRYDLDMNYINTYSSLKEAMLHNNNNKNISSVCLGSRKTASGYIWRYKNYYDSYAQ